MSRQRLKNLYKKNKIKYGRPEWVYTSALKNKDRLNSERKAFAKLLWPIKDKVLYMDQSSFSIEHKPGKTWQLIQDKMQVLHPGRRSSNLTLFGVSGYGIKPVFMITASTNQVDCVKFLELVKRKVQRENLSIVVDNHKAHHSLCVKDYCNSNGIRFLFQPAYSSQFNSQERVWAYIKRNFRNLLATQSEITPETLRALLEQSCSETVVSLKVWKANQAYIM